MRTGKSSAAEPLRRGVGRGSEAAYGRCSASGANSSRPALHPVAFRPYASVWVFSIHTGSNRGRTAGIPYRGEKSG